MKKSGIILLSTILLLGVLYVYGVSLTSAQQATSSLDRRLQTLKEQIATNRGALKETREDLREKQKEVGEITREKRVARVRQAVKARWNVLSRATQRAEILLNKLQVRVNEAKTAGKDVTIAEQAMVDAQAKLADAKSRLAGLKDKENTAVDKAGFQSVQSQFQAIRQDLKAVSRNGAKIISTLRGFNATTSLGKNPQSATPTSTSR